MSAPQRKVTHDGFPLRTVTAMTGLSPDIIRAWEKRYGVVTPLRGARGARLYSAADIAHLRVLGRAVAAGRAIGDVAMLSERELSALVAQDVPNEAHSRRAARPTADPLVARVLELLTEFDQSAVARLLGDALIALGPRAFVHEVVVPVVDRVGAGWAAGEVSVGGEHLLTATLRGLLLGLMQNRVRTGRPVLLVTPSGERHEIGLLMVALLVLEAGRNVVYLGVDLPAAEIARAAGRARACVVGLSLVASANRAVAAREVTTLGRLLPRDVELWLGGCDAAQVASHTRKTHALVVTDLSTAEAELQRIAPHA